MSRPFNTTTVAKETTTVPAPYESIRRALEVDPDDVTAKIIGYVLLGVFFGAFTTIVAVDIRRKYISGDFQDDARGVLDAFASLSKCISGLCVKLVSKDTYHCLTRLFKREHANAGNDLESAPVRDFASMAIVERLAAKAEGAKVTVTAEKVTSTVVTTPEVVVTPPAPDVLALAHREPANEPADRGPSRVCSAEPPVIP